jgi:hypothetical protein
MPELDHSVSAGATPSLGLATSKQHLGILIPEPTFRHQFRPRCAHCGAPSAFIAPSHPLSDSFPVLVDPARAGRSFDGPCRVCDTPFPPSGPVLEVPAALTGASPRMLLARVLLAIGRFFARLSRGFPS